MFTQIINGGYWTLVTKRGGKISKVIAQPLQGLHHLMQLVGLRGTRMKFYLENILAGKVSVATAAKQAQRVKSRLRFRNYLLDSISILRQGNMTWGEAEITWEWLRKNEIVPQSLEDQYCSFFKSNVPEPRYQKEIDEKIKNCWNQWVSLGVPLLPSSDNEQGGGWLKKNYPGKGLRM